MGRRSLDAGRLAGTVLAAMMLAAGASATDAADCTGRACGRLVYFGTHGDAIVGARLDERTGRLIPLGDAAAVPRPTWLVAPSGSPALYATSETGNDGSTQAEVYALRPDVGTGRLETIAHVPSGGGGATHLAYDSSGHALFVANYGTGDVALLPVGADGRLSAPTSVQRDVGSGPSPRQKSAHAHGVAVAPGGRHLLVTDLGADRLFLFRIDRRKRTLAPGDPSSVAAPAGSGPRHAVFLPRSPFVYVNSELSGEIAGYRWDDVRGALKPLFRRSLFADGYAGQRSAAELIASGDGRFLYASTRGENAVVVFAVDRANGSIREVQRVPAGGVTPWSIALDPSGRWLLSANEGSDVVTVLRVEKATGRLTATGQSLAVPKPVSVAFFGS